VKTLPYRSISRWVSSSLSRRFLTGTAAGLLAVSLVFLLLFMTMYGHQVERGRLEAAARINRVMQTSLEAAMLRRDLGALRLLVDQLGADEGVEGVMIVNPEGEIRFSNHPKRIGDLIHGPCPPCDVPLDEETLSLPATDPSGRPVLRTVHPVHNKPPCVQCHGAIADHPINGVLLVDYDTRTLEANARDTTLALMGSGAVVVFINLIGGWWFMGRYVLRPVGRLTQASRALAAGNLEARAQLEGEDELAELGRTFDRMAESLQASMRELRGQRAFLQALIDAIPDGIRVIDPQFRIVLANSSYEHQLGIPPGSAVGQTCFASSHRLDEPCPPTLVTCPVHEVALKAEPLKAVHRHIDADGQPHDCEIYAAPLRRTHNGEEEVLVVESIRDLAKDVKFSHEQRLAELGRLAAGVAHEIRNPLSSIRLTLESATRDNRRSEVSPEGLEGCLRLVMRETDRCLEVTERLLKLSMFAGEELQVVSVTPAVEETVSLLYNEAEKSGVQIGLDLDPSMPRIMANESDLRMVVLNLLQNAFHAMPAGGTITARTRRTEAGVELEFSDTGVGVAPADLPHIFDPFFSRRADRHEGTGLGLAITRTIVQRHRGRIEVDSTLGKGTTFVLRFPDADSDEGP